MKAECGKRHGRDIARCELPKGHDKGNSKFGLASPAAMADEERWQFIKRCFKAALGKRYCAHGPEGCYGRIEADHIIARSDGGKSEPENCQLLCKKHHAIKHGNDLRWTKETA